VCVLAAFQKISFLPSGGVSERPGEVKGALFAAKRILDREDRSEKILREGMFVPGFSIEA